VICLRSFFELKSLRLVAFFALPRLIVVFGLLRSLRFAISVPPIRKALGGLGVCRPASLNSLSLSLSLPDTLLLPTPHPQAFLLRHLASYRKSPAEARLRLDFLEVVSLGRPARCVGRAGSPGSARSGRPEAEQSHDSRHTARHRLCAKPFSQHPLFYI